MLKIIQSGLIDEPDFSSFEIIESNSIEELKSFIDEDILQSVLDSVHWEILKIYC